MLGKMMAYAAKMHEGQFDKGGKPYFLHCLKVMHYVQDVHGYDEELLCIAVGHDLIEDTKATFQDLADLGMTIRVIRGVHAMTKQRGQTYEEYKEQIFGNRDAMLVKLQDLRHNSDIRRLKGVTEKDMQRTVKYQKLYHEIEFRLAELNIPEEYR